MLTQDSVADGAALGSFRPLLNRYEFPAVEKPDPSKVIIIVGHLAPANLRSMKMADRKQFLSVLPVDPELTSLLSASKDVAISEEVLREQRISFAFGNALNSEAITKESVRSASQHIRLL